MDGIPLYAGEQKDHVWKAKMKKTTAFEARYSRSVRGVFARQQRETLERFDKVAGKSAKAVLKFAASDINSVLFDIKTENKVASEATIPVLRDVVEEIGQDTLNELGLDKKNFDTTTETMKAFFKRDALKSIDGMNKTTKNKLRKKMSQGVANGDGIPEISRAIRSVFEEASTSRAERIARTEVLTATNKAALEAYKQSDGLVIAKEWYTAMDEKVCPWCGRMENGGNGVTIALDANFFERGESFTGNDGSPLNLDFRSISAPPLHPNCRCTLIPVVRKR